jgi:hypothetical protein
MLPAFWAIHSIRKVVWLAYSVVPDAIAEQIVNLRPGPRSIWLRRDQTSTLFWRKEQVQIYAARCLWYYNKLQSNMDREK